MASILHIMAMENKPDAFPDTLREKAIRSVLLRKLTASDIKNCQVILIDAHCDQRALCHFNQQLEQHLCSGGTVVFNGHLEYPVFSHLNNFQVAAGRGFEDLLIERVSPHPVFHNVRCEDISIRRGVAGFYARGANPAPANAVILHRLIKDHSPVDWVWRRPAGGQIFMHSGNNMWMYLNDDSSAKYIVPQLISWALAGAPFAY